MPIVFLRDSKATRIQNKSDDHFIHSDDNNISSIVSLAIDFLLNYKIHVYLHERAIITPNHLCGCQSQYFLSCQMVPQHRREYLSSDSMANSDDDVKRKHCVTSTWVLNAISLINFLEPNVLLSSESLPIVHSSYRRGCLHTRYNWCFRKPNGLSLWKDDDFLSDYVIPWQ